MIPSIVLRACSGSVKRAWSLGVRLALLTLVVWLAAEAAALAAFPGRAGRLLLSAETEPDFAAFNAFLWDYNPRTGRLRQLTSRDGTCRRHSPRNFGDGDHWMDGGPDYSPSGRRIAYLHADTCPGGEARTGLWVMRADGSNKHLVAPMLLSPDDPSVSEAAFSPSGKRIAVASGLTLTVYDAARGRLVHQLVRRGEFPYEGLDWGIGGRLAYGIRGTLYTSRPDGTDRRQLTRRKRGQGRCACLVSRDARPDWSPTGGSVVFQRQWWAFENLRGQGIWATSPGGGPPRQLPGGASPDAPSFSPDGMQVAMFNDASRKQGIATVPAEGSARQRLLVPVSSRMTFFYSLDWQPLGRP